MAERRQRKPRFAIYFIPGILLGFLLSFALGYGLIWQFFDGRLPTSARFSGETSDTTALFTSPVTTAEPVVTTETAAPEPTEPPGETLPHGLRPEWTAAPSEYAGLDPLDVESDRIVPLMHPVDDDYFSDAVFIGNSIVGLQMLAGTIDTATYYTRHSLQVESYFTQPIRIQGGVQALIPDALEQYQYKKVYLMLGVNEMSWPNQDVLADLFDRVIKNIVETQPDAIIYVQSVLPVEAELDRLGYIPNNKLVQQMNRTILRLCEENGVWFLNSAEALYDENGVLPEGSTSDGTHFGSDTVKRWDDYLRTHAIPADILNP
ncbi:MAG TPA: hypothetical protein GXZ64_09080 [Clostridiaceae bacterium]|nr:hypothetical protein [Clostridiaceae bacterium]